MDLGRSEDGDPMKMTVLAYDGLGQTLTVECSASDDLPDGSESPIMFVGRTQVTKHDVRDLSRAELVHAVARELMSIAMGLAENDGLPLLS